MIFILLFICLGFLVPTIRLTLYYWKSEKRKSNSTFTQPYVSSSKSFMSFNKQQCWSSCATCLKMRQCVITYLFVFVLLLQLLQPHLPLCHRLPQFVSVFLQGLSLIIFFHYFNIVWCIAPGFRLRVTGYSLLCCLLLHMLPVTCCLPERLPSGSSFCWHDPRPMSQHSRNSVLSQRCSHLKHKNPFSYFILMLWKFKGDHLYQVCHTCSHRLSKRSSPAILL